MGSRLGRIFRYQISIDISIVSVAVFAYLLAGQTFYNVHSLSEWVLGIGISMGAAATIIDNTYRLYNQYWKMESDLLWSLIMLIASVLLAIVLSLSQNIYPTNEVLWLAVTAVLLVIGLPVMFLVSFTGLIGLLVCLGEYWSERFGRRFRAARKHLFVT